MNYFQFSLELFVASVPSYVVVVWCSVSALVTINVVILHRARLVLGWVMFASSNCIRSLSVYFIDHPRQLSLVILPGRQNEYQYKNREANSRL